jgi:threonyl-tRNA synthetase
MACHDPPAVIDSFERFFGVLIEQIAGKWAVLAIPASSHDHSRDH